MSDKLEGYSKVESEISRTNTLNWAWPGMFSQTYTCGDLPRVSLDHLKGASSLSIAQNKRLLNLQMKTFLQIRIISSNLIAIFFDNQYL